MLMTLAIIAYCNLHKISRMHRYLYESHEFHHIRIMMSLQQKNIQAEGVNHLKLLVNALDG